MGGNEEKEKRERKERRDKGQIRLTPRDLSVLHWIGEQYGVRLDQLRRLLGRDAQRETKVEGLVAAGTAKRVVKRWRKAGLAERQKFFHKEPSWIWLTRKGLSQFELPYSFWEPNVVTLKHIYWVNQARLYIEKRRGRDILWWSERDIKQMRNSQGHYVDAEVEIDGNVVGLEVELTPKKLRDLKSILVSLAKEYTTIWYFTNSATRNMVERNIAKLPASSKRKFRIYDLGDTM